MSKVKDGFLLGTGAFLAFTLLNFLMNVGMFIVALLLGSLNNSGMSM